MSRLMAQVYTLIVALYQMYPAWLKHDLYLFGESYAGKYIPAIAIKILLANKQKPCSQSLSAASVFAMADCPNHPNTKYAEYAFSADLIDELEQDRVDALQDKVVSAILNKDFKLAEATSNQITAYIVAKSGGVNYYNVWIFGDYNVSHIDDWLNLNETKTLFHVLTSVQFVDSSSEVYDYLINDIQDSIKYQFPNILSQLKVLLYNAQDDLIVCTPGADAWISSIPWKGQNGFSSASQVPWIIGGEVVGNVKSYSTLMKVLVNKAGHLSPMDQTANTLDMANRFVYNQTWS